MSPGPEVSNDSIIHAPREARCQLGQAEFLLKQCGGSAPLLVTLVYGVCIGDDAKFEAYAAPGLQRIGAASRVIESRGNDSIFRAYNEILDAVRERDDLSGLVLLHEDLEIRDDAFEEKVQAELADERVGILGTVGGRGPVGVRWSQCHEKYGHQPDSLGDIDFGWDQRDVDLVDGCLLVLSPWVVKNLRFEEDRFSGFHAYDADICMQVRTHDRLVRLIDIDTFHHTKGGYGNVPSHQRADEAFRRKWGLPQAPIRSRVARRYPVLGRTLRKVTRAK